MLSNFNNNPKTKHYIYHKGTKNLYHYNLETALKGGSIQNNRATSKGLVNSGNSMRKIILGY